MLRHSFREADDDLPVLDTSGFQNVDCSAIIPPDLRCTEESKILLCFLLCVLPLGGSDFSLIPAAAYVLFQGQGQLRTEWCHISALAGSWTVCPVQLPDQEIQQPVGVQPITAFRMGSYFLIIINIDTFFTLRDLERPLFQLIQLQRSIRFPWTSRPPLHTPCRPLRRIDFPWTREKRVETGYFGILPQLDIIRWQKEIVRC